LSYSREEQKFNEWAEKIRSTLAILPNEEGYADLPDQCRLLKEWGDKLRKKDMSGYLRVKETERDLLSRSANELNRHYMEYLNKAEKHRHGTRARINEILRYIYYYSRDVHANLVRAERKPQASEYLRLFWKSCLSEIREVIERDFLDDFQIECVLDLAEQSKHAGVGLEFVDELISKLRAKAKKPQIMLRFLKSLVRNELLVLADGLSEDRRKWHYDKRSNRAMAEAIAKNCSETDLASWLRRFCGKELPKEMQRKYELEIFPSAIQIGRLVLGPLGLLEGSVERPRSSGEETRIVLERYLGKEPNLHYIWKEVKKEIPPAILKENRLPENDPQKHELLQVLLAYGKNECISSLANQLLEQGKIRFEVPGLYDRVGGDDWLVTKYGILTCDHKKESVENLADLLRQEFKEEELAPEFNAYHGDSESKVLEYCIKENPERILTRMFGLIRLKQLAKRLGFRKVDSLQDPPEISNLILLKFGFDVPPPLEGCKYFIERLRSCSKEIVKLDDLRMKSGLMSQAYVDMERSLRDLLLFYVGFLWKKEVEDQISSQMGYYEDAVMRIMKDKLEIENPQRMTFGETLHAIRKLNAMIKENKELKSEMDKTFNRTWILDRNHFKVLDEISGQRRRFVHPGSFPGTSICIDLIDDMANLLEDLLEEKVYPSIVRIVAEISDDYGKNYSRVVDENGSEYTIYIKEWLDATVPYFMYSKTTPIAVNPVLVEKIE
jgi:hypothetical protein